MYAKMPQLDSVTYLSQFFWFSFFLVVFFFFLSNFHLPKVNEVLLARKESYLNGLEFQPIETKKSGLVNYDLINWKDYIDALVLTSSWLNVYSFTAHFFFQSYGRRMKVNTKKNVIICDTKKKHLTKGKFLPLNPQKTLCNLVLANVLELFALTLISGHPLFIKGISKYLLRSKFYISLRH